MNSTFFLAIALAYGSLAVLIVISDRPRLTSPLGMMAGAYGSIALGVMLQAYESALPYWLGLLLGNLLAWLGLLYQGWAIRGLSQRQQPAQWRLLALGALLVTAALVVLLPPAARFAAGNLVYAVLFGFSAWALLRWAEIPGSLRAVTSSLFVVTGSVYVVRAVEYGTGIVPPVFASVDAPDAGVNVLVYPVIFTTLISGAFSLLLLNRRAVEQQLRTTTEQLAELAAFDALTGLRNRRTMIDRARAECSRAVRTGRPLVVSVLDLDRLKLINDVHGHAAGDEALRRVAAAFDASFREQDCAGRLGGDEFAVLLPDSDLAQGRAALERMQTALGGNPLVVDDFTIHLSVSVGVVEYQVGEDVDEVFSRADRAMYVSKRAGGASVVCAEAVPDVAESPPQQDRLDDHPDRQDH